MNSILSELNFDSIKLEPSGKDLSFRQAGDKIYITLDKSYSPADLISVRFKYSAKPDKGIYFVEEKWEKSKILHSSQIWTQNEPEEARQWFPSYDFPDDKATSEQFLTVEKDETAIGNGELIETIENSDGTKTFHYKMPVPSFDLSDIICRREILKNLRYLQKNSARFLCVSGTASTRVRGVSAKQKT